MYFMVGMGLGYTQFVGFLGFMGKCVASGNADPVECQLCEPDREKHTVALALQ